MEEQTPFTPQGTNQSFGQEPFNQTRPMRPKNWLLESILVTVFCCLPFGIAGIVNASNVNSRYDAGDFTGALAASIAAGKWTKLGFFISIGLWILYIIAFFIFGAAYLNIFRSGIS